MAGTYEEAGLLGENGQRFHGTDLLSAQWRHNVLASSLLGTRAVSSVFEAERFGGAHGWSQTIDFRQSAVDRLGRWECSLTQAPPT